MKFTEDQKIALARASMMMLRADGHAKVDETMFTVSYWQNIGIDASYYERCKALSDEDTILTLKSLDEEQKRFTSAFLGTLMSIDKDIAPQEERLMQYLCDQCQLPQMTIEEAQLEFREYSLTAFL